MDYHPSPACEDSSLLDSLLLHAYLTDRARHSRAPSNEFIRGVNLGGWLVLEPWITPSIFEQAGKAAVDEYTLCQILGPRARSRLHQHWSSWITQGDFVRMSRAGLNHVRIPIGYWALVKLPGDPYVDGQLEFMDKAVQWARETNMKVMIDLHGGSFMLPTIKDLPLDTHLADLTLAPGSQNGFDNSGRRGDVKWGTGHTVQQTLRAIRLLAKRYARMSDVVTSIELMNEPFPQRGVNMDKLKQFYYDGWGTIREYNPNTQVVISDAFQDPPSWNGFMSPSAGISNTILDTHHYQVFDHTMVTWSINQHVDLACAFGREKVSKTDKPTIIGEWSGALTDCAKYLNGRGQGARYDGTFPDSRHVGSCVGRSVGSVTGLSVQDQQNLRRFIEAQLNAAEMGRGWVFWTWKTEGAPEWDMQQLIQSGVFPQPLTDRRYPRC